jgi:MinD-like ATPase involved in chromosome partitioning or flagellar assembly
LLALARRDRIVAIDTNPDYGSLGRTLTPHHGIFVDDLVDVLGHPSLTVTQLDTSLGRGPHGLMVLPAPTDPSRMARLDEAAYTSVIRRLQDLVGVIVLDCGTGLQDPASRAAMATADEIVLISDAEPATASLVAEAARRLTEAQRPLFLVVNKMPAKGGRLNVQSLAEHVPNASGLVMVAAEPHASSRLARGEFNWADAPHSWQVGIGELAVALIADWAALGLTLTDDMAA